MATRRRLLRGRVSRGRLSRDASTTTSTARKVAALTLLVGVALGGCSSGKDEAHGSPDDGPHSIVGAEGAVCGMVIRDQPAPRAQVVHRDGTRLYLCGIADLMAHLEAPSPHGAAIEIYVEAMEADEDPREIHLGEHEWIRAEDAIFRIGDERPRLIMGRAVMVYRDRATAEKAIRHGPVEFLDFDALQAGWRRSTP